MILHLPRCMGLLSCRIADARLRARQYPNRRGFATAGAPEGRPARIVASLREGAESIVTFMDGILT